MDPAVGCPPEPVWPEEPAFSPFAHALIVLVPLGLTLVGWLCLHAFVGARYANEMAAAAGASLFGLGATVILGPAVFEGAGFSNLSTADLVVLVTWLNAVLAFVYTFSQDLIRRVPRVGPYLHRCRENARAAMRERPWIRRWATFGVGFFVLLPLPGSGSLGGSVVGGLAGLSRMRTFLTVSIASAAVAVIYGVFAEGIRGWFDRHQVGIGARLGGLVALGIVLWLLFRWLRRVSRPAPVPVGGTGGSLTSDRGCTTSDRG